MHGVCDFLPAGDLVGIPDPGDVGVVAGGGADEGPFGDEERVGIAGALGVVGVGGVFGVCAVPG